MLAVAVKAGPKLFTSKGRRRAKWRREIGALKFKFDADDEEAFTLLKAWKSHQYVRTGLADVFSFPWTLDLLARLHEFRGEDFSVPFSVLRAGDKVAAVCLSFRSRGVLHGWFSAYNPDLHSYSPGFTFFVRLAERSAERGIQKIDLGRGEERCKWSLASGSVELSEGSVSSPSLATLLGRLATNPRLGRPIAPLQHRRPSGQAAEADSGVAGVPLVVICHVISQ